MKPPGFILSDLENLDYSKIEGMFVRAKLLLSIRFNFVSCAKRPEFRKPERPQRPMESRRLLKQQNKPVLTSALILSAMETQSSFKLNRQPTNKDDINPVI